MAPDYDWIVINVEAIDIKKLNDYFKFLRLSFLACNFSIKYFFKWHTYLKKLIWISWGRFTRFTNKVLNIYDLTSVIIENVIIV